jgi:hypothetical protein
VDINLTHSLVVWLIAMSAVQYGQNPGNTKKKCGEIQVSYVAIHIKLQARKLKLMKIM